VKRVRKPLPHTSATARYHSLRVLFRIQEWKGDVSALEPSQRGWKEVREQLLPNTTEKLLEMFRCECKTGFSTLRCTCLRYGLLCSSASSNCEGLSYTNIEILVMSDIDNEEDKKRVQFIGRQ